MKKGVLNRPGIVYSRLRFMQELVRLIVDGALGFVLGQDRLGFLASASHLG